MLEKGVNWNDLEVKFKRGTYIKRVKTSKPFSKDELATLPLKHQAHKNPDLIIGRSVVKEIEYPIFNKIKNMVDVIFFDAEPIIETENIIKSLN
jgi:hypothetical protein